MGEVTPALARSFLAGAARYLEQNPGFDCIEWRIAHAYLAEHARAEAAESERDRLAERVAELEAAAAPVEWRTFEPDEPPLWMVRAHEKRGGWWQTRQVRRFRVHTNERGAYIDSKAGEVDERQEWRCDDGRGNPLPWPVHGAEGVTDAQ